MSRAVGVLSPRERRIFEARRLAEEPMTLADLAAEFGVSCERVRQIEVRAFGKVQKAALARAAMTPTSGIVSRRRQIAQGWSGKVYRGEMAPLSGRNPHLPQQIAWCSAIRSVLTGVLAVRIECND